MVPGDPVKPEAPHRWRLFLETCGEKEPHPEAVAEMLRQISGGGAPQGLKVGTCDDEKIPGDIW